MFKPTYVNLRRRDLLKKLLTMGVFGTGSSLLAPFSAASSGTSETLVANSFKRGEEAYNDIRRYSLRRGNVPDRYPDIIVRAQSEQDVREALQFANDNDLQVVCRATGHGTAAPVLRNGGMMLDISALNKVSVDPLTKTATVQPGVIMQSLYYEISRHGLDFPTTDCTTVAVAGYILGGGQGKNTEPWTGGPACYALLSAEVLLASGRKVTVDKDNFTDIFWAMRGCGPAFFGIILSYTVQLFEELGCMLGSRYSFPVEALPGLLKFFDQHQATKDPRVTINLNLIQDKENPDQPFISVSVQACVEQCEDPLSVAKQLLVYYVDQGLTEHRVLDQEEYTVYQSSEYMTTFDPSGRTHTDNIFTDDSSVLQAVVAHFTTKPKRIIFTNMILSHGMQNTPLRADACYSAQGSHYMSCILGWNEAELDTVAYGWLDKFSEIIKPYAKGHYLNQINTAFYPEKVRQSFTEENWARLQSIRSHYDPGNRFFTYVGLRALS